MSRPECIVPFGHAMNIVVSDPCSSQQLIWGGMQVLLCCERLKTTCKLYVHLMVLCDGQVILSVICDIVCLDWQGAEHPGSEEGALKGW